LMGDRVAAVTGATGFLGGYIVNALAKAGWQVRTLVRRKPSAPSPGIFTPEMVVGDIGDRRALGALVDGAEIVIHAAGLIKASSLAAFRAVNVDGTANLVGAINDSGPGKHLLLVSSMVAREPQLSSYAASKRDGEEAMAALRGHDWSIARPCAVYGPRDRETLVLFQAAARGILPLLGPARGRVALIHAADAADAVAGLCERGQTGRIFELTDRRIDGYSWLEIAAAAEDAVGTRALTVPLPAVVVRAAAAVNMLAARLSGRTPIFTPGKAREILHADWGSAADRQPPTDIWQPAIELAAGFRDSVSWYRDRDWLPAAAPARP
jgi:nucleoside-diphosphate-sugar epimerase